MAGEHRWIFTREEITNTPSRKCGIDSEKELNYRQQAANLIQDMGQRLHVTQLCINTAIVYMHRFYMFHSFTKFHRNSIASAALFLAAKVEEQPRKLEHVIKVFHVLLNREQGQLDTQSEQYLSEAQDLVINENIMLQSLGFDITVDHPHGHVVRTCTLVKASKDLAQTSYFLATNSLHLTQMCLIYKPTVVACVCMHLACKWSDYQIPRSSEGKEWFSYVDRDVTSELLEELTCEFLAILDRCPSKLKKKILTWKAGGRDDQMGGGSPSVNMSAPPPPPPPQDRHRHRPPPSAAAGSAASSSHEHHQRSSHDPAKPQTSSAGPEGMRRVRTEPIIAGNHGPPASSISAKEYLQRKERDKVERSRDRHHHGLPQHSDGRSRHDPHRHGDKQHDPNRSHQHRAPGHPSSQQKHAPPSGAPDAKVPKVEKPAEQKERSNIFDKMQLESSNTSTPEPLFDHLKIKESLDADLMDMSKDATLPSSNRSHSQQDMNQNSGHMKSHHHQQKSHREHHGDQGLKSSSKQSVPHGQRPPHVSQKPSSVPQGSSDKGDRSSTAAAAIKNQLRSVKPGEGQKRPHGPLSHREKHSQHSAHQKRLSSNAHGHETKPASEMTAFEKALNVPNILKSPTNNKSELLSPSKDGKESLSSPTTPKEQRIPVDRGMLLSSERKRKRLPSICVEDRELLELKKGASPKIVLERVESSDSENNSAKGSLEELFSPGKSKESSDIMSSGTPKSQHEKAIKVEGNVHSGSKTNSSKVESDSKMVKKEGLLLSELKKDAPSELKKETKQRKDGYPSSASKKELLHPVKKDVIPTKQGHDGKTNADKDRLIKQEFSMTNLPEKLTVNPVKSFEDKKEPGELSPDTPISSGNMPKIDMQTVKKNDLIPDMSDLVTENKVTDSPSSGSLKLTLSKSLMNNSPMSDGKSSKKEKDREHHHHRHKEKKHKRHKEKHKRSRSPGDKSSHKDREKDKESDKGAFVPKLKIKIGGHGSGSDSEKVNAGNDEAARQGAEAPVLKVVFSKDKSGHYSSGHHKHKKDKDKDKSSRKRHRSPSHKHSESSSNPHKMSRTDSALSVSSAMGLPSTGDGLTLENAQKNISMMIEHLSKQIADKSDSGSPSLPPLPRGEPVPPPPPPPATAPPRK